MQRTSDTIWISFGADDDHTLYEATVCSGVGGIQDSESTICRIDAAHMPESMFAASGDAVVYFHGPDGFLQQPIHFAPEKDSGKSAVRIEPIGIAAIAEDRRTRRFGATIAKNSAVLASGDVCPIADTSVRGLSVISNEKYTHEQIVDVAFEVDDEVFSGRCRVRSVSPVRDQTRYGLLVMHDADGGTLPLGLRRLTAEAESDQARRMPKAG